MLSAIWNLGLGALSWVWSELIRRFLRWALNQRLKKKPELARSWRTISKEMIQQPGAMASLLTTAPRWNPHAVIATTGPISVQKEISIDREVCHASAGEWTVVVCRFGDHQVVETFHHSNAKTDQAQSLRLPAGDYQLFLRYYHRKDSARFPSIYSDGQKVCSEIEVDPDTQQFYPDLIRRDKWFYRTLNFYVFPALKYLRHLTPEWVDRRYLPLGNPETQFLYGYFEKNEELCLEVDSEILNQNFIYITLYNRSSLPWVWEEITETKWKSGKTDFQGFYLVRVNARSSELPSGQNMDTTDFINSARSLSGIVVKKISAKC